MPPLPPVPGVVRVKLQGTNQTVGWVNVFYMTYSGTPPSTADCSAVATSVRAAWLSAIAPAMLTGTILTGVEVADMSTSTGAVGSNSTSAAGTKASSAPLPVNCAVVISYKVNRRYRGGHPRNYLPGPNAADVSNGRTWQSAYQTVLNAMSGNWPTALNAISSGGSNYQLAAVSYYNGGALRTQPLVMAVTSCVVHTRLDSMRRRLGKEIA